jgi:hypothetical protein
MIRGAGRYSTLITPTAGSLFHAEFHFPLEGDGFELLVPRQTKARDSRSIPARLRRKWTRHSNRWPGRSSRAVIIVSPVGWRLRPNITHPTTVQSLSLPSWMSRRRAPIPTASALQSDRQRIAVGYPDVHPNSSIDAQKKTAAEPLQKHTARPLPSYGRFHYTAPTDQTDQTLFTLAKKRRRAGDLALLSFIHRPAPPQPASGIRSRDTSLFTLLSSL